MRSKFPGDTASRTAASMVNTPLPPTGPGAASPPMMTGRNVGHDLVDEAGFEERRHEPERRPQPAAM